MEVQEPLKYMKENDKYGVIIRNGRFAWDKQDEDEDDNGDGGVAMPMTKDPNGNIPAVTFRPAKKTEKVDFSVQCDLGSDDEDEDEDEGRGRNSEKDFKPDGAISELTDEPPQFTDPNARTDTTRRKSWDETNIKDLISTAKSGRKKDRKPPPEKDVSTALYDLNFVLEKVGV